MFSPATRKMSSEPRRSVVLGAVALAVLLVVSGSARAQTFPTSSRWAPLLCSDRLMEDGYRDQAEALDARDLVGDQLAPAAWASADAQFLYLGVRVDQDPRQGDALQPFGWGFAIDLDDDASAYELLLAVDGNLDRVALYANQHVTVADSPADPADDPPLAVYPFATHGRVVAVGDSAFGADRDYLLELAVPWSDLDASGLTRTTPVRVWVGSSSVADRLDGDLACHDGHAGASSLSGTVGLRLVLDPFIDSDGDGFTDRREVIAGSNPADAVSVPSPAAEVLPQGRLVLEGAGGCAVVDVAAGDAGGTALTLLALAGLAVVTSAVRRKRRGRCKSRAARGSLC